MTSREIVRRCIEFEDPPRIGLHFQTDPIQGRTWNETDFAGAAFRTDPRFDQQPEAAGMTVAQAERQYKTFKRYAHYPLIPHTTRSS